MPSVHVNHGLGTRSSFIWTLALGKIPFVSSVSHPYVHRRNRHINSPSAFPILNFIWFLPVAAETQDFLVLPYLEAAEVVGNRILSKGSLGLFTFSPLTTTLRIQCFINSCHSS
ncbi:hypothetical protein A0H81_07584 [Grifola frondosa]|uniref:Uncharacterized protein n=1 Tax=Grifola frondosa TaxID=5627 RepID=A0A1C7M7B9_GRIFR|nr:hypothetical protein A0H81_07584 [Grifola frondosa]